MAWGKEFEGAVVLVTGAASGIGAGVATAFARAGARVMLADLDRPAGEALTAGLQQQGAEVAFTALDVTRAAAMSALVTATVARFGRLDILHNNAGISGGNAFTADVSEDEFDRVVAVNLKSVWLGMKMAIPQMLEQGGGVIINTASALALTTLPGSAPYIATKHAVAGLTRTAAVEYARHNVRINAVCPGVIRTAMLSEHPDREAVEAAVLPLHPAGRLGEVRDVVDAVMWLASPRASFVHGTLLSVDGGWTAA